MRADPEILSCPIITMGYTPRPILFGSEDMRGHQYLALVMAMLVAMMPAAQAGPTLLFDATDGTILYAEDQDDEWHPASLTKIMTAYVTFEAIKAGTMTLDTQITCSKLASVQPATRVGMVPGAKMSVRTALQVLIIHSANDVAVMLAEAVAGTHEEFVARMNAAADRLGMTRTKFVNANGLPDVEQVTTARDLAKLASAVLRDYPEHADIWSLPDVHIGKRHFGTFNGLLANYAGADGMKTGFTCDSGYNVVASATRARQKLIAVVLGEPTGVRRTLRAASLLEHGFAVSGWKSLLGAEHLDILPVQESAKGAMSMRKAIISWACGTARPPISKTKAAKARGSKAEPASGAPPALSPN
jgi:D-alanyl-D-alanine carboxypeptidase